MTKMRIEIIYYRQLIWIIHALDGERVDTFYTIYVQSKWYNFINDFLKEKDYKFCILNKNRLDWPMIFDGSEAKYDHDYDNHFMIALIDFILEYGFDNILIHHFNNDLDLWAYPKYLRSIINYKKYFDSIDIIDDIEHMNRLNDHALDYQKHKYATDLIRRYNLNWESSH